MTPQEQFQTLLAQSGLSQAELGRRLGRGSKCVNDWNMGYVEPPKYVISWLTKQIKLMEALEQ